MSEALPSPVKRLTGSEILLRKLPLYGQAKQFMRSDVTDSFAECNTLSYGSDRYPILSMIRDCRTALLSKRAVHSTHENMGGLFHGIQTSLYASPSRRRWEQQGASSDDALQPQTALEESWLSELVSLPAQEELLAPIIRPVVQALADYTRTIQISSHLGGEEEEGSPEADDGTSKGMDDEAGKKQEEEGLLKKKALRTSRKRRQRSDTGDEEEFGEDYSTVMATGGRPTMDTLGGGDRLKHMVDSTAEEAALLDSIRQVQSGTGLPSLATQSTSGSPSSANLVGWGAAMMSIIKSQAASPGKGETVATAKEQQCVSAYLKRIGWVEQQRGKADAATATLWAEMTPAQRVRQEMSHTAGQRARFSRDRKKD